jgi:hypothetical protein
LLVSRITALALIVIATAAAAETIHLPQSSPAVRAEIARACPECTHTGVTACGSADVQYGRRFAPTALQGAPRRGYLVSFVMTGEQFRALARVSSYTALVDTLRERFSNARLVVLEHGTPGVRVLPAPASVEVTMPPALHACVKDATKPWGCCVSDCRHECCEKGLGSPSVSLTWNDSEARETVRFTFHHQPGYSRLERRRGQRTTLYYCLADAAARID